MIKVLIVDDEATVRRGLRRTIPWQQHGFEVVGEADDGAAAIELTEELKPDIIITDICMPLMDGLEYIKLLKKKDCLSKIIILSGHDKFAFAKDAIEYGVYSYVLKPIDNNELIQLLLKAKEEIENDRKFNQEFNQLRQLIAENRLVLKERFLYDLIRGSYKDCDNLNEKMDFFQIEGLDGNIVIMVADIDNFSLIFAGLNEEERQLRKFAAVNIIENTISKYGNGYAFNGKSNQSIIIYSLGREKSEFNQRRSIMLVSENIKESIYDQLGFTVSIGISKITCGTSKLGEAYEEALEAVEHKSWIGKNSIIFIEDIKINNTKTFNYPIEEEQTILLGLKRSHQEMVLNGIESFFQNLSAVRGVPIQTVRKMVLILAFQINRTLLEMSIDIENITGQEFVPNQIIDKYQTVEDIKEYMVNLLKRIITFLINQNDNKFRTEIKKAIAFIEANICDQIDLNSAADHVHLSPYYLSRLFKKETGKNFVDYVVELRMERAKELLLERELKMYHVAEKVGYHDTTYFSQLFKKHTGVSPADYRKSS